MADGAAGRDLSRKEVADAVSSFPREHARTRRFTLGAPRTITVAADGSRVAFLRSATGDDPVQRLWVLDVATGEERCVADPLALAGGDDTDLPPEERARRERTREQATGIVGYATDRLLRRAVFPLGGGIGLCDLLIGDITLLDATGPVVDPRLDATGRRLAWVSDGRLLAAEIGDDGTLSGERGVADEHDPDVTWGLAEFVAAEEMDRTRGFWWSPTSERIAAARVDISDVQRWHLTDPSDPSTPPQTLAYPAAGTRNADVRLVILDLDGGRVDVEWDRAALPYLAAVRWDDGHPLTLTLQSRDQRRLQVVTVDPANGAVTVVHDLRQEPWTELVPGLPRWLPDGRLLVASDEPSTRRLAAGGRPLSPPGLQVREVVETGDDGVLIVASGDDPTATAVWRLPLDGGEPQPLTALHGIHGAASGGATVVLSSASLDTVGTATTVRSAHGVTTLRSHAHHTRLEPCMELLELGERGLRAALLLPSGHREGDGPLPVLLDPYGGPHAQRVVQRRDAFGVSQWFAEAGFAVLVADGRGTPGRGPAWEQSVAGDLASAPLDDQIDALHAAAARRPVLDLGRVGIRGWSFGGYLAALAVLRRPDVFHAAVAGAPVTDWRLYDTHYTERYLGLPQDHPQHYETSSLLPLAPALDRPLLLIHGLADDNVVAAHTLQLSRALLEAGRPHRVLPLSGVTHMTPQEVVAEHLLRLQLDFLQSALR